MVKLQSHKKIVIESDLKRQTPTDAKQAVLPLPSRDPRTVCMTKEELGYLVASFRVNRWPGRAEKERLARLIGKPYEKVHHWFSNQRQKVANVEKVLRSSGSPETPPRRTNPSTARISIASAKIKSEKHETPPSAQDTFIRGDMSDMSDISIEEGARILLEFVASVRAAYRTPSP
ncbi:hypothetical protein BJV78DRAFT_1157405 [Lactifluus subvellereus]|nr:hypothetical protein BJV78DRAFT_1157405 [Lactifluus subvellereus]